MRALTTVYQVMFKGGAVWSIIPRSQAQRHGVGHQTGLKNCVIREDDVISIASAFDDHTMNTHMYGTGTVGAA